MGDCVRDTPKSPRKYVSYHIAHNALLGASTVLEPMDLLLAVFLSCQKCNLTGDKDGSFLAVWQRSLWEGLDWDAVEISEELHGGTAGSGKPTDRRCEEQWW